MREVELWLGLGYGNAVCGEKVGDECAVEGAFAFDVGGGWRFTRNWAIGLELSSHRYAVRDAWQGNLEGNVTDVSIATSYFALLFRWYPRMEGPFIGYLQLGLGGGALSGDVKNAADDTYEVRVSGPVFQLGGGGEWYLGDRFRLGPQASAYLLSGSKKCETTNGDEDCGDAKKNDAALPWRLTLQGTFLVDL